MMRSDFKQRVARRAKTPREDSDIVVEAVFEELKQCLLNGDEVNIYNFGRFFWKKLKAKKCQIMSMGSSKSTPITVPERCIPWVVFSPKIVEEVKKKSMKNE